ncbi:MAG TPA: signal peptidase II [Roseimicrobium sp.]|nr:signal peptidase II [Roseimicrobium sp.]
MNAIDNRRLAMIGVLTLAADQFTKWLVLRALPVEGQEIQVVDGFFRFVHWGNTGAAWSMFHGNNEMLAIVSLIAFVVLLFSRHHFDAHTKPGQVALGLLFGGILGNVIDRLHPGRLHVVDFLYFHVIGRSGREHGFPAFNVADSAICVGVGLLFWLSWRRTEQPAAVSLPPSGPAK